MVLLSSTYDTLSIASSPQTQMRPLLSNNVANDHSHPSTAGGVFKLRRALAGRRKNKSQDLTSLTVSSTTPSLGTSTAVSSKSEHHNTKNAIEDPPKSPVSSPRIGKLTMNLASAMFSRKSHGHPHTQAPLPLPEDDMPPLPPPKHDPPIHVSPPSSSLSLSSSNHDKEEETRKEGWRKSDSTTASAHTIRPLVSATSVIGFQIDSSDINAMSTIDGQDPVTPDLSPSPTSIDTRTTKSISSPISSPVSDSFSVHAASPPTVTLQNQPDRERRPTKRSFSSGVIIPESFKGKSRVGGWVPTNTSLPSASHGMPSAYRTSAQTATQTHGSHLFPGSQSNAPPALPALEPQHLPPPIKNRLRQTATSLTSNASTSVSTTFRFGRRAMEKMGGIQLKWANSNSSSPATMGGPGYSSSSSSSSLAQPQYTKRQQRRTPDGPSGSWSIHSLGSGSDIDLTNSVNNRSPHLGALRRGPLTGTNDGGLVFGKDLATCVHDTRAAESDIEASSEESDNPTHVTAQRSLHERLIPAIVLRCAIHLRRWGMEEEGLFRISGRSTHINKLRTEFDSGADWDMLDCSPADLDPHAVASVFKAYLRELPEPILTRSLSGLFEATLAAEHNNISMSSTQSRHSIGRGGLGLPSGPKARPRIIKPPSITMLSSAASDARGPSELLVQTLAVLISRLPQENRDTLETVAELIRDTASKSQFTKMPLTNLLLVFCPSLNMSPSLLRVLCENEYVWKPIVPQGILDIRSQSSRSSDNEKAPGDDQVSLSGSAFNDLDAGLRPTNDPRRSAFGLLGDVGDEVAQQLAEDENLDNPSPLLSSPYVSRSRASTISTTIEHTRWQSLDISQDELVAPGSASGAALVSLSRANVDELEEAENSSLPTDEDGDQGSPSLSRRHTLVARLPIDLGSRCSLVSYSSESRSSLVSKEQPSANQAVDNDVYHSTSTSTSSSLQVSVPLLDVVPPGSEHVERLHLLRQLRALSVSELGGKGGRVEAPRGPSLRHVLSLNLMRTNIVNLAASDAPISAKSLPSPKALADAPRSRLPSKLNLRFRRQSTDLSILTKMASTSSTDTDSSLSPISPPPRLTLPFESVPSSPIDISVVVEDVRDSNERLPSSHYRYSIGRARSSPLLNMPYNFNNTLAERSRMQRSNSSNGMSLGYMSSLANEPSIPPKLSLGADSPTEHDWAQSVLQAAKSAAASS